MTISLSEHLMALNADLLKGWLRRVDGLEKTMTRKDHFARAIEQQLTQSLAAVVTRLSEGEKILLAESAHQNRLISAREYTAKYGGVCPMPKGYYGYREEVSLLVPFISQGDYRLAEPPALIASLVEPLCALLPKPAGLKVQTVDALPKTWSREPQPSADDPPRPIHVFEGARLAPAELGWVLRLVQAGKVKITDATCRPTDATTRLVGEALIVPDFDLEMPPALLRSAWDRDQYQPAGPVRAHAWPVLIQQCGWAKGRSGVLTLTEAGKAILQQFTPERFRAGVSRCLGNDDFDELNRVNHIRGQGGKAKRQMSDPALRKSAIVEAMEPFPVGQWLTIKEASRLVAASPEGWDVVAGGRQALYFCELQYGAIYETSGINRQFLRAFLFESLATLGLLDVAYIYPHHLWPDLSGGWGTDDLSFCGRYDGLLFVRLNPLGAYALDFTDRLDVRPEETSKLFRILPNLDLVLAIDALNPADRATVGLFAAPKSERVWTLDPERMLTHVETGGTFRELRGFLEANAEEGLPDNVQVFLAGLEAKLSACRGRRAAVLLEWTDEALALLIATSAGTNKLCFHAGGNRLAVPAENFTAFSRALKRLGYVLPQTR